MARLLVTLVLLLLAGVAGATETTEEPAAAPEAVSAQEAKKRVAVFEKHLKSARRLTTADLREAAELDAVRTLGSAAHERIAARLGEASGDESLLQATRAAALAATPAQGDAAPAAAEPITDWLRAAADRAADDLAKNRIGLPVDPRTGGPVTGTPEADEALRVDAERARLVAAGIATLRVLDHTPKRPADLLRPFLQSPHDDLAVAALETAQAWDAQELAQDLALLLRMYPRENRWETGAVTHLSGTNASAKAAWTTLFGHPQKQRPRPAVHRAVVACLSAFAGRPVNDPAACDAWLSEQSKRSKTQRR